VRLDVKFKERRTRVRLLEQREPDGLFRHPGWYNAFQLYPNEKQRVPWLEPIRFKRSVSSAKYNEYRQAVLPIDRKSRK